jgi:serine/threonine protein kinase
VKFLTKAGFSISAQGVYQAQSQRALSAHPDEVELFNAHGPYRWDSSGSYDILAPIGAGGMGEVYRAHDRRLKRDVTI